MGIPTYDQLMLPLLKLAGARIASDFPTAERLLGDEFNLTPEERATRLPSGQQTALRNRTGWASFYLMKAGLLIKPKRGYFEITQRGRDVLESPPASIDKAFLANFAEFREFLTGAAVEPSANADSGLGSSTPDHATPDEALQGAYQQLRSELASQVLERLLQVSPEFFEQLVVELLVVMGYGGSRRDAGERIGRSGDGGIDGIIKEDRLGLDVIYIQAKRWQATVGRPEIQKFVGALHGQRARKGVFMTTSAFSADARDYVSHIDVKVVLLDGIQIANLMIDHGVGVTPVATYVVKRLDSDYFDEV
ncbi:restriction endonuclease [Pseudoxanthomonas sp. Root630]|uniref:restriction endonuclease n=1 Tax=Pseudoxanthomonas sp. Root630 TaxID=1736574 RepID=UPI000703A4A1|nr:restriction endonuclease [Pseudoxanthomonas sp. Root630]KRA45214.1 restriction endonuclease [Pseudoxanthomonas sp. Root630]